MNTNIIRSSGHGREELTFSHFSTPFSFSLILSLSISPHYHLEYFPYKLDNIASLTRRFCLSRPSSSVSSTLSHWKAICETREKMRKKDVFMNRKCIPWLSVVSLLHGSRSLEFFFEVKNGKWNKMQMSLSKWRLKMRMSRRLKVYSRFVLKEVSIPAVYWLRSVILSSFCSESLFGIIKFLSNMDNTVGETQI